MNIYDLVGSSSIGLFTPKSQKSDSDPGNIFMQALAGEAETEKEAVVSVDESSDGGGLPNREPGKNNDLYALLFRSRIYDWQKAVSEIYETDEEEGNAREQQLNAMLEENPIENPGAPSVKDSEGISPVKGYVFDGQTSGAVEKGYSRKTLRKIDGSEEEEGSQAPADINSAVFGKVDAEADLIEDLKQLDAETTGDLHENIKAEPQGSGNRLIDVLRGNYQNAQEWLSVNAK